MIPHSLEILWLSVLAFVHTFFTILIPLFSEGRFLLELTHKQTGEGETWVPIKKKVYWPPPGPVKAESSPSVHSGKFIIQN